MHHPHHRLAKQFADPKTVSESPVANLGGIFAKPGLDGVEIRIWIGVELQKSTEDESRHSVSPKTEKRGRKDGIFNAREESSGPPSCRPGRRTALGMSLEYPAAIKIGEAPLAMSPYFS
jgi:hypothetical protein